MKTVQLVSQLMVKTDSFPTVRNKPQTGSYSPHFFSSPQWRVCSGQSDQEKRKKRYQSREEGVKLTSRVDSSIIYVHRQAKQT